MWVYINGHIGVLKGTFFICHQWLKAYKVSASNIFDRAHGNLDYVNIEKKEGFNF